MIFLLLFIIPFIVCFCFYLFGNKKVSTKEFITQLVIQFFVVVFSISSIYYQNTYDVEVLNGRVVDKKRVEVSCEHSYSCNCRTECSESCDSDHDCHQSCSMVCDTCYEHDYDVDWNVYTDLSQSFTIQRVDRRGLTEPLRWTNTLVKEPISINHVYTNYIKASPNTLFKNQSLIKKYVNKLINYPINIYDYWKIDRLVSLNTGALQDQKTWNSDLMELNAKYGRSKQANILIVFVRNMDREYFYALQQFWYGGKKNDIISVVNLDSSNNITWVEIMTWANDSLFSVKLRDDLLKVGKLDREMILSVIDQDVGKYYSRKSMKNFSYLKSSVVPSAKQLCVSLIIGFAISIGLGIFFYRNDETN